MKKVMLTLEVLIDDSLINAEEAANLLDQCLEVGFDGCPDSHTDLIVMPRGLKTKFQVKEVKDVTTVSEEAPAIHAQRHPEPEAPLEADLSAVPYVMGLGHHIGFED